MRAPGGAGKKRVEDAAQIFRWNADAVVGHFKDGVAADSLNAYRHVAVAFLVGRVLDGVADDLLEDEPQPLGIAVDGEQFGRHDVRLGQFDFGIHPVRDEQRADSR